jgi:hypothetical protein
MNQLEVYKLQASQLASLLQILGALVADYISNPRGPMKPELKALVKMPREWAMLPALAPAIQAAIKGGDKVEPLYALGQDLKSAVPQFRAVKEYTTPELTLLNALRAYLSTDSESALNYIKKHASVFGKPELAAIFKPEIPQADHSKLRKTVKTLVGRDGVHLSVDEAKLLKARDPAAYEKYAGLRKDHNASFKATLTNYVREADTPLVPYQEAYKAMNEAGFTHSMVPGFNGLIDDHGRWYTKEGRLIDGAPNLATYVKVVMNDGKDPDAKWEFKAIKADGGAAYAYTKDFKQNQSAQKYANVADLMEKLPGIRAKWLKKLKAFNIEDPVCVAAVVLEVLYSFAARIGSKPGRGAGTLQAKNVSETQQGYNLAYIGKDSIPTKHVIKRSSSVEAKWLCDAISKLLEGKKPSDMLYTVVKGNRQIIVPPAFVNKTFRALGAPEGVTVHKLRTVRGTHLFRELVDADAKKRPPSNEKEAMLRWKDMTEQVGKLLNHKRGVGGDGEKFTGITAAGSYVDSGVQLALFERWGFRAPAILEKLFSKQEG